MTKDEFLNELYIVKHHTTSDKDRRIIQLATDILADTDDVMFNRLEEIEPEYPESRRGK